MSGHGPSHDQDVRAGRRRFRIGGQFDLEPIGPAVAIGIGAAWIGATGRFIDIGQGVTVDIRIIAVAHAVAIQVLINHQRRRIAPIADAVVIAVRVERIGAGCEFGPVGQAIPVGVGAMGIGAGHSGLPQVGDAVPVEVAGGIVGHWIQPACCLEHVGHPVPVGVNQRVDHRLHQEQILTGLASGIRVRQRKRVGQAGTPLRAVPQPLAWFEEAGGAHRGAGGVVQQQPALRRQLCHPDADRVTIGIGDLEGDGQVRDVIGEPDGAQSRDAPDGRGPPGGAERPGIAMATIAGQIHHASGEILVGRQRPCRYQKEVTQVEVRPRQEGESQRIGAGEGQLYGFLVGIGQWYRGESVPTSGCGGLERSEWLERLVGGAPTCGHSIQARTDRVATRRDSGEDPVAVRWQNACVVDPVARIPPTDLEVLGHGPRGPGRVSHGHHRHPVSRSILGGGIPSRIVEVHPRHTDLAGIGPVRVGHGAGGNDGLPTAEVEVLGFDDEGTPRLGGIE